MIKGNLGNFRKCMILKEKPMTVSCSGIPL